MACWKQKDKLLQWDSTDRSTAVDKKLPKDCNIQMLTLSCVIQTAITAEKQPERRKKRKRGRKVAGKEGIMGTWSTTQAQQNQKGSTPTAAAYQSERKKAAH